MRWLRPLPWLPPALLAATLVATWAVVLRGGLTGVTAWYGLQTVLPLAAVVLALPVVFYTLWARRPGPILATVPVALVALWPAGWLLGVGRIPWPADPELPGVAVRLPLDGPVLVGWGGDTIATNYHVASPDQRWAYDLLVEPWLLGSRDPADFGCYGLPVLAPADARVHAAVDGRPDSPTHEFVPDYEFPLGNHVVLDLPDAGYLVLAHLAPGSVAVKPGQQVREGDVLGACGNSGNSSEPHVHIHHQRQDPTEFPVGFAEGLPLSFRDLHGADGPRIPIGGLEVKGDDVTPLGEIVRHGP